MDKPALTPSGSNILSERRNIDLQTRSGVNKNTLFSATAQNLTGTGLTTVATLDRNSSINASTTVGYDGNDQVKTLPISDFSEVKGWEYQKFHTNQFAPRGWGSVLKTQFLDDDDYILIDLGTAANWSTNTYDDNLVFWLGGEQTAAGTVLDLELIADDGSTSKSDNNVTAYAVAREWQLINLDVSGDTLDDVEYIKIQCDTATGDPVFYFSDFVRTLAATLTNDAYAQVTSQTNLGCPATDLEVILRNMAEDETARLYVNSLANSPYVLFPEAFRYVSSNPIHAFWINSVTADTTVDYYVQAEGVYL